jgi:hypothetical protein
MVENLCSETKGGLLSPKGCPKLRPTEYFVKLQWHLPGTSMVWVLLKRLSSRMLHSVVANYLPEDGSSTHLCTTPRKTRHFHARRSENLKSHLITLICCCVQVPAHEMVAVFWHHVLRTEPVSGGVLFNDISSPIRYGLCTTDTL